MADAGNNRISTRMHIHKNAHPQKRRSKNEYPKTSIQKRINRAKEQEQK